MQLAVLGLTAGVNTENVKVAVAAVHAEPVVPTRAAGVLDLYPNTVYLIMPQPG
eukprot:SAG31_NODE_3062_length_4731_cov_8.218480_1_plen_54_part_00